MTAKEKEEKNEEKTAEKSEKKGKKRSPLLKIILVLVPVMILGGGAAFYFISGELPFFGDGVIGGEESDSPPRYSYSMQEFQVNLADPGTSRFLRTTFDLAYDARGLTREIEDREPELRSEIIAILRSKYIEDLEEPGGMKNLEKEILDKLNEMLDSGEVKAIYFKEFIFQ